MSDEPDCLPQDGRRRGWIVIVFVLVLIMAYSTVLLRLGVAPVWLVPITTGVVAASHRLLRAASWFGNTDSAGA